MNNTALDIPKKQVSKPKIRKDILEFEDMLSKMPNAVFGDSDLCPVKHTFTDGIYTREMFIPKGVALTGVIWKNEFPFYVTKGELVIVNEYEGKKVVKAPSSLISKIGTKRAIYALEDSILITIHHNPDNCKDTDELMDRMSSTTYAEYESKKQMPVIPSSNCGLKALKNVSNLKNISVKTLIGMAEDNGLKLYPYKVALNELKSIPFPAIVHSKNHFEFISKKEDFKEGTKYTGNVLLTQVADYPKIKNSELKKIDGKSGAIVAAAIGLVGTVIGVSQKSTTECGQECRSKCKNETGALFGGRKECKRKCKDECVSKLSPEEQDIEMRKQELADKKNTIAYIIGGTLVLIGLGVALYVLLRKK